MGRFLQLGGGATAAVFAAAVIAGCANTPPAGESRVVSVRWEIYPETDSCGKIAGSLALYEMLNIDVPPDVDAMLNEALERRCPDTDPESFDFEIVIPESACGELKEMLDLAHAFGVTFMLAPAQQRFADDLIADLDDEIDKRCPSST